MEDSAVHWASGWCAWKRGDYRAALREWQKDGILTDFTPRPARNYYWRARALDALGRHDTASGLRRAMAQKYPFDYYTFLAFPEGAAGIYSPATYAKMAALFYPMLWKEEVAEASRRAGLPAEILWAVMRRESKFRQYALSRCGAVGLMQLMPSTAEELAEKLRLEVEDLYTPQQNILMGAVHFAALEQQFDGDLPRVVAAYNAGASTVSRWNTLGAHDWIEWLEEIPYPETREYVRSVLENREVYCLIMGRQGVLRLYEIAASPFLPVRDQRVAKYDDRKKAGEVLQ